MENDFLIRESGTHYTIRAPIEGHDLVVMVDKKDFTITIPYFEYMHVESIAKAIAKICTDDKYKENPVVRNFLAVLREPVNEEELGKIQKAFRSINRS